MLDIHTHLYFPQYDDDRDETIKRAFDAGLSMLISVSTEPEDHHKALAISALDERIFASVGLHPHYFNEQVADDEQQSASDCHPEHSRPCVAQSFSGVARILDSSATVGMTHRDALQKDKVRLEKDIEGLRILVKENSKIIAIGECGLDYFSHTSEAITDEQRVFQREGFIAQIRLAQEFELPMIIHCRDAYEDLVEVISEEGRDTKFILHCYMGDAEVTQKFLALPNVYFSFTGNITYPVKKMFEGTKDDIRETVKTIPLERMFMETDCPFLAPVPYRGKRNEPSFVVEVAKKIAEIKDCSQEALENNVRQSIKKVFHLER